MVEWSFELHRTILYPITVSEEVFSSPITFTKEVFDPGPFSHMSYVREINTATIEATSVISTYVLKSRYFKFDLTKAFIRFSYLK